MSVAEFIVDTQWTLLILLVLGAFVLAMICSRSFRAAILRRSWSVGPDGITSQLPADVPAEAFTAATQSDRQAAEELAAADQPDDQQAVKARRLEAIETLLQDAVARGWASARAGNPAPPSLTITDEADGAVQMGYTRHEANTRSERRTWHSTTGDTHITVNAEHGVFNVRGHPVSEGTIEAANVADGDSGNPVAS